MSKVEKREITIRRLSIGEVFIGNLTDNELQEIISNMEADMDNLSSLRNINTTVYLFAHIALKYAMRLYEIEHFEKATQKAEEKRLDETITMLKDFLKKP